MTPRWHGVLGLVCILSAACDGGSADQAEPPDLVGHYTGTPTTTSSVDLTLFPDGSAMIEVARWEPDGFEHRDISRVIGRWERDGSRVTITYGGRQDVLQYADSVSAEALGWDGTLPGLTPVPPLDVGGAFPEGVPLWRAEVVEVEDEGAPRRRIRL